MKLILASASARRRELLDLMGYDFEVIPADANEVIPPCAPALFAQTLAREKARAVSAAHREACVVGCDTIVWLDGEIIGKPVDEADAFQILRKLSGRTHTVYTGAAILLNGHEEVFCDETRVSFNPLTHEEILAYIATGEPLDKAGAYGIQGPGSILVERIEGCYFTVMGLPNPKLYRALRAAGILPRWMRE